jgi:PST family polysaccharide transporter
MMAGLAVLREPFIVVLLGSKWLGMANVLLWLSAVGFVSSLTCTTGAVLMARGRTNYLFYLGIVGVLLQVPAFIIGLRWGVEGVAAGHLVATVIISIIAFSVVLRVLGQGTTHFLRSVARPIALAAVMALVVAGCQAALPVKSLPAPVQLIVPVLVGGATYLSMSFFFARESLREVSRFFRRRDGRSASERGRR